MSQSRYEIVGTIGVGGSSRVDKAHDTIIDRTVALKTFGHGFGSKELQKEFLREAQILGRLSHPNIVAIYDVGTGEDGSAYLVTEFVPGKTLESVILAQDAIALPRLSVWAAELASALNLAHRAGIIHGDIKPANIFLTEDGRIKLGDFGIARFATQLSGSAKLVGTPAYLSPEQIKGEAQDHRSDIFSLGVVLYQLATGVRPFDGTSVTAVCAQIVATDPAPPSQLNRALPKDFDRVVMRCLAKDPKARYAKGESLAASLYPFARSNPEANPGHFDLSWWKRPLRARDAWICAACAVAAMLAVPLSSKLSRATLTPEDAAEERTSSGGDTASLSSGGVRRAKVSVVGRAVTTGRKNQQNDGAQNPQTPRLGTLPGGNQQEADREHGQKPVTVIDGGPTGTRSNAQGVVAAAAKSPEPGPAAPAGKPTALAVQRNGLPPQVALNIEIDSVIEGETLAIYADQHLVATAPLTVTTSTTKLHLERPLPAGPHEFRVALYRPNQSLHLEREGLADLRSGAVNLISIRVVRRAKMLVKRDTALEILWPLPSTAQVAKHSEAVAIIADSAHNSR